MASRHLKKIQKLQKQGADEEVSGEELEEEEESSPNPPVQSNPFDFLEEEVGKINILLLHLRSCITFLMILLPVKEASISRYLASFDHENDL